MENIQYVSQLQMLYEVKVIFNWPRKVQIQDGNRPLQHMYEGVYKRRP